ncbi:MAG: hypothetical protein J2P28_23760, partial [Actinobacteria bacterium]|nr:hypothetical protein [Actinomycetota bacterium]
DRYLLCSDGLTDVVEDKDVHKVLSTVPDADEAVGRLIALAIRNGGPDNITCIVADVVDEVGPVPPTRRTQLAGAAANGDARTLLRQLTGHAAAVGADTAVGASMNGHSVSTDPVLLAEDTGRADDAVRYLRPRRRWPVVSSVLVLLVVLIGGGLYFGYQQTQNQYYLAKDGSNISIFRGINEKVGFISLSKVYRHTNVPVSHVPHDLTLPTTPTSLAKSQATLTSIEHTYACTQYHSQYRSYLSRLSAWTARYGKQTTPKPPPKPAPPTRPSYCTVGAG